ncbi:hypothetical protein CCH79_00017342, partial [Gambusia affinis]
VFTSPPRDSPLQPFSDHRPGIFHPFIPLSIHFCPVMKGLSSSRSHHHMVSYEPSYDPLGHHVDRKPYLFGQMDMPLPIPMPHPSELPYYNAQRVSYPSESNTIVPYGTFPRRCHSTSSAHHPEVKDECMAMVPYVGGGGRGGGGGGGYGGKSQSWVPVNFADPYEQQPIFSRDGYHTLQYKRGVLSHAGGIGANDNNDSPGRIRHLVHSVQKLFTKSHSLEGPQHTQSSKGPTNGSVYGGGGGGSCGGGARASPEGAAPPGAVRHRKRSKSRERCRSAEPKHRSYHHHHHPQLHGSASAPGSGYWSSDDNLERELCLYHPHHHQPPPSPSLSISPSPIAMTTGPCPGNNSDKYPQTPLQNLSSSQSQHYFIMDPYGTVNEHAHTHARHGHTQHHSALKASRSNSDMKYTASSACMPVSGNSNKSDGCIGGGSGPLLPLGLVDGPIEKKGAWSSSLTVSRAREVYTNTSSHNQLRTSAGSGNLNLDRALVKSKGSQQQDPSCQFLQVPQDEWSGFSPLGKEDDIPCRRMRSGSYVKAMAEDDSGDSDGSPKPSPKMQARRASYLKATQPSLTEMTTLQISTEHSPKLQIRSHSYLRAVSEVSINRSLDTLDPKTLLDPKSLLSSPQYRSRNESYMRAMSTISQLSEVEVNGQIEQVCEQVYSEMQSQAMDAGMDSLETMDTLPMPGCFRMRSPSYVRAIDQGCASEDEGPGGRPLLLLPSSPPRTTATTVRTIQSSTVSSCITTYKKTPPPVPPRTSTCSTASKPYISITAQSSTESAQADLDLPDLLDTPLDSPHPHRGRLASCGMSRKYSRDAATSTVSIQGSGNHYHACASDEYDDVGFDPSILPPPDPWIDTVTDDPLDADFNSSAILEVVQRSVCQRDGRWFLKLLQAETDRMDGWCRQMELDQRENELPEDSSTGKDENCCWKCSAFDFPEVSAVQGIM